MHAKAVDGSLLMGIDVVGMIKPQHWTGVMKWEAGLPFMIHPNLSVISKFVI